MEYLLIALVAGAVGPGLALLVAAASGYFVARWLGIPEFRPFRRGASETRIRRFFVRTASIVAAFAACFVFGMLSARVSGTSHSSMVVDVVEGPAKAAGLRGGDRIVSIDGKTYDDFEAFRADVQSSTGPRTITVERNGERITRVVDPMPERRIGVSSRPQIRAATLTEAIDRAFSLCLSPRRHFRAADVASLAGPVNIVRSLERAQVPRLALFLYAGALYAAYVWPALLLLHVLDALILRFRRDDG